MTTDATIGRGREDASPQKGVGLSSGPISKQCIGIECASGKNQVSLLARRYQREGLCQRHRRGETLRAFACLRKRKIGIVGTVLVRFVELRVDGRLRHGSKRAELFVADPILREL